MQERKIRWKSGANAKIDAEVCYRELERIRAENGGDLTAELVVSKARPRGSVLRPQVFDKSQRHAAEEYYRARARETMRCLVVVYEQTDPVSSEAIEVRTYSTVDSQKTDSGRVAQVYSSTEEALQDATRREYVLAEAIRQVAAWRKKYAALSELAKVFRAIDEIVV